MDPASYPVATQRRLRLVPWSLALLLIGAPSGQYAWAGPPFVTDDPEPVEYHHWELYLATQHELTADGAAGTAPHVEVNAGPLPGVQLHAIVPLAYQRPSGGGARFGAGDIELGVKLRLHDDENGLPMVGVFPLVELPVGSRARGLGSGHVRVFLPLWLQKSFGAWTTYGGGGYWLNPGVGNRDAWLLGWELQRKLSERATLGGELYYATPDQVGAAGNLAFNLGLMLDVDEHQHVLVSAGRSLSGDVRFQTYLAYQLTL